MTLFSPKLEILPAAQRQLWPQLAPVRELGFTLYGGTAVALRLGHRQSVDFDFFSDLPLDRGDLHARLAWLSSARVIQDRLQTFTVLHGVPEQPVKVSFFGHLTFGRVAPPELTEDRVLSVAAPEDLLAHKLKVILQRVEAKDYRDLAALLCGGGDLARGLAGASALFGLSFAAAEAVKALVYFKGGDLDDLPQADRDVLITAVRSVRTLPDVPLQSTHLGYP